MRRSVHTRAQVPSTSAHAELCSDTHSQQPLGDWHPLGDALPPQKRCTWPQQLSCLPGGEDGCTGAENQESEFELQPEIDLVFLLFALESR